MIFFISIENSPRMSHLKEKAPVLRHSKLQYKYTPRVNTRYQTVPELRISGAWLAQAGFSSGQEVAIEVFENQLIIKPRH